MALTKVDAQLLNGAVTADSSGNVGIGTTSPADKLDVTRSSSGNSTGGLTLTNTDNSGYGSSVSWNLKLNSTAGVWGRIATEAASTTATYMPFYTATSGTLGEKMRIASSGFTKMTNSGSYLGATGSYHEMTTNRGDVIAYFTNSSSSTPYGLDLYFSAAAPNNTSQWFHLCEDTGGLRFVALANGGIKNYSANNVNLSDQSVKKDINLAGNYLDKICAIPVKTFLYIDQTDADLNLGVIAQDVQAVAPELVTETDWGSKDEPNVKLSVYESDLMFALMKSIQELNAKVEAQAAEIAALKAK